MTAMIRRDDREQARRSIWQIRRARPGGSDLEAAGDSEPPGPRTDRTLTRPELLIASINDSSNQLRYAYSSNVERRSGSPAKSAGSESSRTSRRVPSTSRRSFTARMHAEHVLFAQHP